MLKTLKQEDIIGINVHIFENTLELENKTVYTLIRNADGEYTVQIEEHEFLQGQGWKYSEEPIRTWNINPSGISISNQMGETFEVSDLYSISINKYPVFTGHHSVPNSRYTPKSLKRQLKELFDIKEMFEAQQNIAVQNRQPIQFNDRTLKDLVPVFEELHKTFKRFRNSQVPFADRETSINFQLVLGADNLRHASKESILTTEIDEKKVSILSGDFLEITDINGKLLYLKNEEDYAIPISESDLEYTFLIVEKSDYSVITREVTVSRKPDDYYMIGSKPKNHRQLLSQIFASFASYNLETIKLPQCREFMGKFTKLEDVLVGNSPQIGEILNEEDVFISEVMKLPELSKKRETIF